MNREVRSRREFFSFLFLVFCCFHHIWVKDGQWTPEGRKIGTLQATGSTFKGQKPIFPLCLEWHCHLQELNGRLVDTSKLGKTGERQINTVKELEKIRERVRALCVLVSQTQAAWRNNSLWDFELQRLWTANVCKRWRPASRLSSSRSHDVSHILIKPTNDTCRKDNARTTRQPKKRNAKLNEIGKLQSKRWMLVLSAVLYSTLI